jgi:hypothetical protein
VVPIVKASACWGSPEHDVLTVFVEPPVMEWIVEPADTAGVSLLLEVDDAEAAAPQETGRIAGIEIVDFLGFDQWSTLPVVPQLWQLGDQEPSRLTELLRRLQHELRTRGDATTRVPRRAAS